ncbi:MAG: trypsin-like peptidase domain-containing protein [Spirochaetales bacterium]|nr:trypsin-like peptidase domain-containing protein [Spirochaetales bacterium]
MRLYSRKHLAITAGISIAVFILAGILFGFVTLPFSNPNPQSYKNELLNNQTGDGSNLQYTGNDYIDISDISEDEKENIQIYKILNEAVVNITSVSYGYNWFLEPVPQAGTGSGSIIDQQGHIVTNYHVIKDSEQLFITLSDGTEHEGKIIGVDPENDLAVIKFDPKGKQLMTIPFGVSSSLMVGQKVLAIGNPFGLERTLTTGIVSGVGRPIKLNATYVVREMIQTDASINPGNSGGPLLNSKGEMIGINTIIYTPSGGSVGIGFAVPIDIAKRVIPELIQSGKVNRGWIDIVPVQLFPALVDYAKLPVNQGILISETTPGGNAIQAGLKGGDKNKAVRYRRSVIYLGGDIIVEVDNLAITSLADLYAALEDNKPGEVVSVKAVRNGTTKSFSVKLVSRAQFFN